MWLQGRLDRGAVHCRAVLFSRRNFRPRVAEGRGSLCVPHFDLLYWLSNVLPIPGPRTNSAGYGCLGADCIEATSICVGFRPDHSEAERHADSIMPLTGAFYTRGGASICGRLKRVGYEWKALPLVGCQFCLWALRSRIVPSSTFSV